SAEDSLYGCVLNYYEQGVSLKQAEDLCAIKLTESEKKGFETPFGKIGPGTEKFFDPSKVSAACSSGNPKVGQSSGIGYVSGLGQYTWGGDPRYYYGLSKEESKRQKDEAVEKWNQEKEKFNKLDDEAEQARLKLEAAKKTGDKQKIEAAQKKYNEAKEKAINQAAKSLVANDEAKKDPNQKPQPTNRTVAGETPAEQALQPAPEFLYECNRTQWGSTECQQLQAKMNHCPDPTMIFVDPDQGYSCGVQFDPAAAKEAWVARCEQRAKFDPENNPCVPPKFKDKPHFI